jgi:hypothetical protein
MRSGAHIRSAALIASDSLPIGSVVSAAFRARCRLWDIDVALPCGIAADECTLLPTA